MRVTFKELYCTRHHLKSADFVQVMLERGLYPHIRPLYHILDRIDRGFFDADREFLTNIGELSSIRQLRDEADEYSRDRRNRRFLRRVMRLRVSSRRVQSILRKEMAEVGSLTESLTYP